MNKKKTSKKKIDASQLQEMLFDINVNEEDLAPYIMIDSERSRPFNPQITVNPKTVEIDETAAEGALILNSMNGISRWRRQRKYEAKIRGGWTGLKIVEDGDSWHQYPLLLKDVIDQLFDDYAIYSFSAAGDVLASMVDQDETFEAIKKEKPDIFMISGGGNDLLGQGALRSYLKPYNSSLRPDEYLGSRFDTFLSVIVDLYKQIFDKCYEANRETKIICHGYDYAIPNGGRWLGRPMEHKDLRINDKNLQKEILVVIIDRLNSALQQLVNSYGNVYFVDCRDAVTEWHDELHPTNEGYKQVANRFRNLIQTL